MGENNAGCGCEGSQPEIISVVRASYPEDTALYELSDFYKVFADSTRIRILWALLNAEMCVCHLCELLGMQKSAISHQLRSLKDARLVRCRRAGKNVFYSLDDEHVRMILESGLDHIQEKRTQ